MEYLSEFLMAALSAVILQNAVFTRGLGSSKDTIMMSSTGTIVVFGGMLTVVTLLSTVLSWPLNYLLRAYRLSSRTGIPYLPSLGTLLCICLVFSVIWVVSRTWFPVLHYVIRPIAIPAAFNCAVMGTILIAFSDGYGFLKSMGFSLGSGVGYTLALLLLNEGRKRIALSDVPRSFRGLPVMLLYVGILSLAIYGLIGHQLPT